MRLTDDPGTLLALYRISQAASSSTSPREAYNIIAGEIQRLFAPRAASICLISPNTNLLEKEFAIGYSGELKEAAMHLGKSLAGRAAFLGAPILCNDVSKDPRYVRLIEDVRSTMVAPMISQGQIIGVIDVDSDRPDAFDETQLQQLSLLANEAARSLQSVWSQRQLRKDSEQLRVLIDVGQNIVSNLEARSLWERVAEAALQIAESRLCALQLYDEKTGRVTLQATRPADAAYLAAAADLPVAESLAGSAIRTKRQVEFTNITTPDYADLRDAPRDGQVTSCLSTPMVIDGRVIGILNVFTSERHRFANSERRLLQALASLSAVAAQNAELYARVFNSEELLRKNERLTTLGLLAAEIAHEIRNPLTVIKLLFSSLELRYPEGDPRNKDKQVIREKIDQLEEIVSKVLSFGKAPESMFLRCDLDELIRDTCLLVRHKMSQLNIDLEHLRSDARLSTMGNKGQLQQVLLNLIINAAEAMPDGGRLRIAARVERDGPRVFNAIDVEDTGTGIPEGIAGKIFESFLTGKAEGTGLGLSIVKRILRSHHGDIHVVRTGSGGTTMRVELPVA